MLYRRFRYLEKFGPFAAVLLASIHSVLMERGSKDDFIG